MTFISYAQNFEDVMLWRVFKDIKNGYYVDVGSQDPVVDSVSYAFSQNGWKGLSVEPTEQYVTLFKETRPQDDIIQAFVSDHKTQLEFYVFPDTGLSTANSEISEGHKLAGFECVTKLVETITLDDVLRHAGNREIHWLKIDVEGHEEQVVKGWTNDVRPWVLVLESFLPLSGVQTLHKIESYHTWEPSLLEKGYEFVYADGPNRFYLHKDHLDLKPSFRFPPNVLEDDYITYQASQAEDRVTQAEHRAWKADCGLRESELAIQSLRSELGDQALKLKIIDDQRSYLESMQAALKIATERQAELLAEKCAFEIRIAETKDLIAKLEAENAHKQELLVETANLESTVELMNQQIAELEAENAHKQELQGEMARLESCLETTNLQIAELNTDKIVMSKHEDELLKQIRDRDTHIRELETELCHRKASSSEASRALEALHRSLSWKITRPLRESKKILRDCYLKLRSVLWRVAKPIFSKILLEVGLIVKRHPGLKEKVLLQLHRFPRLASRMQRVFEQEVHKKVFGTANVEQLLVIDGSSIEDILKSRLKSQAYTHLPKRAGCDGMRIILDMREDSIQSTAGQFTMNHTKALLRNAGKHEYILLLSDSSPEFKHRLTREFHGLLADDRVIVWNDLPDEFYKNVDQTTRATVAGILREQFISGLQPDLIYTTSLPVDDGSPGSCRSSIPTAVTLFHMQPYVLSQIDFLKRADLILVPSPALREQVIEHLHKPEDQVVNIACDDNGLLLDLANCREKHQQENYWNTLAKTTLQAFENAREQHVGSVAIRMPHVEELSRAVSEQYSRLRNSMVRRNLNLGNGLKIVLDLQGAQGSQAERGIGRYSIVMAKAILQNPRDHKIFIALNGAFPESVEKLKNEFKDLVHPDDIIVWNGLSHTARYHQTNSDRAQLSAFIREGTLWSLNPDVLHISSLFEGLHEDHVTSIKSYFGEVPTTVTLYDLIPFINPDQYLALPEAKELYMQQIEHLKQADLLLSISDSSRQEVLDHLGIQQFRKTVTISCDTSSNFRALNLSEPEIADLRSRYHITGKFILTVGAVGAGNDRKNAKALVEAYARLPKHLQNEYQLVIIGSADDIAKLAMKEFTRNLSLGDDRILITGHISERDLVSLYNQTELFVFPSLHEGFGLPALEAMRCGVPVIGSNTSSIPEVIGIEDALFDPTSIESMAAKMEQALTSEEFRQALLSHGKEQQKRFSWESIADRAFDAFEEFYGRSRNSGVTITKDTSQSTKKLQQLAG